MTFLSNPGQNRQALDASPRPAVPSLLAAPYEPTWVS